MDFVTLGFSSAVAFCCLVLTIFYAFDVARDSSAVTVPGCLKRQNQVTATIGDFQARVSSFSEGCSTWQKIVKVEA